MNISNFPLQQRSALKWSKYLPGQEMEPGAGLQPGFATNFKYKHQDIFSSVEKLVRIWLKFHRFWVVILGGEWCYEPNTVRFGKICSILENIARGTTDPGYWLFNLSYLSS